MATPPGSPPQRTFCALTRGVFLSFVGRGRGRATAPPSRPVPEATVASVSQAQPPHRPLVRPPCGADGGASGRLQLILGGNHAAQGGEAASWARTSTSTRSASGPAGLAVEFLRGSREEGGAEHHGCIWSSGMHFLSDKVTSLSLDSFFSSLHLSSAWFCFSLRDDPSQHLIRFPPPPLVHSDCFPAHCFRSAFWRHRWILCNDQNPPRL